MVFSSEYCSDESVSRKPVELTHELELCFGKTGNNIDGCLNLISFGENRDNIIHAMALLFKCISDKDR